jgi:hypothetical protein
LVAAFVLLRWEWRNKERYRERIKESEGKQRVVSRLDWDLAYIKTDCIVGRVCTLSDQRQASCICGTGPVGQYIFYILAGKTLDDTG